MEPKAEEKKVSLGAGGVSVANIFMILAIATVVVAVVFWGISIGRSYQASSIEKKLASVNEETNGLGSIDTDAKAIAAAVDNIQQIKDSQNYFSVLLKEIASQTTKNTQLTELSVGDDGMLSITGGTASYEALAKFMTSLRTSSKFSEVTLQSATLTGGQVSTPITFTITANPTGGGLSQSKIIKEE